MFQFQTFGMKQAEFVTQLAGDKEYAKLISYIVGSMLLFGTIGKAFGMDWDESFKVMRFGSPPAFKFAMDLYNSGILGEDKYGNKLNPEKRAK